MEDTLRKKDIRIFQFPDNINLQNLSSITIYCPLHELYSWLEIRAGGIS